VIERKEEILDAHRPGVCRRSANSTTAASGPPFKLRCIPCYTASMSPLAEAWLISPACTRISAGAVCFNPLHSVVVDYNGKGMLCCQVRSDSAQQSSAVIGDLSQPGTVCSTSSRPRAPLGLGLLPRPQNGVCPLQMSQTSAPQTGAAPCGGECNLSASRNAAAFRSAARRFFRHRKVRVSVNLSRGRPPH